MALAEIKTRPCPECHEEVWLKVTEDELAAFAAGALIQDAFPTMSKDDRERLVTGICGPCWALIFADEDEDEDGDEPFADEEDDPTPTCDLCGKPEGDGESDWNGETGNHVTCEQNDGWREGQPESNGAFR